MPSKTIKKKEKSNLKKESKYYELEKVADPRSGGISNIKQSIKEKFKDLSTAVIINIDISPKKRVTLVGNFDSDGSFTYKERTFIRDNDAFYHNSSLKMDCIDFDFNFSLPIKRDLASRDLSEAIAKTHPYLKFVLNPTIAHDWTISKIIRELLKVEGMGDDNSTIVKVIFFIVTMTFFLLLYMSGIVSDLLGKF